MVLATVLEKVPMNNQNPNEYFRVFAPGVPNVRVVSERFTTEAEAKRYKREILMSYPSASVRIEKSGEFGSRNKK
jgi:hypothetical protein